MPAPGEPSRGGSSRRGHLLSTAKHGSIYALGMILSRLIGFVMIPVYTRVLTPEDYGVLEILSLTTDVLGMLAGLGIGVAVVRQFGSTESAAERSKMASTAATTLVSVFAIVTLAGLALAEVVAPLLLGPGGSATLVKLAVTSLVAGATIEVPMAVLRAQTRSSSVVAASLARLLIGLLLNVILVVVLRIGVAGVLISSVASSAIVGGALTYSLYREHGFQFSGIAARALVRFGAPLILWNIASFVMHYSDRYFLRTFGTMEAVGLYSLSYKLAMLVPLFVAGPFSSIWVPKAIELDSSEGRGARETLDEIANTYAVILVSVSLAIALFADPIVDLGAGSEFRSAAQTVPLLALGMVFFGLRNVAQIGSLISGRSDFVALATISAALVVVGANFALIPRWGVAGAALATAVGFAVEFVVMRQLSKRVHWFAPGLLGLLRPLFLAIVVGALVVSFAGPEMPLYASLAVRGGAMVLFGFLLFFSGAVSPTLRSALDAALKNPKGALRALRGA